MKATQIYRDNFVYNINSPLCDDHAKTVIHSVYSYLEEYKGNEECSHCKQTLRQKAYDDNKIYWVLKLDNEILFSNNDRKQFWAYVRTTDFSKISGRNKKYEIIEKY